MQSNTPLWLRCTWQYSNENPRNSLTMQSNTPLWQRCTWTLRRGRRRGRARSHSGLASAAGCRWPWTRTCSSSGWQCDPAPSPAQSNTTVSSSVQDGIYALGKSHMRSIPSLRSFPSVAFETVLIDDGPLLSFQGKSMSSSFFHASLIQVTDGGATTLRVEQNSEY